MYPQFFGFHKLPFRLRPDPDFRYLGEEYLLARTALIAAIRGSARVILFMGPPGVGKTLLLDDVLQEISGDFAACRINQPHISATELLQAIVMQLGTTMVEGNGNLTGLLSEVAAALDAAGSRAAPPMLVIDDAQLLSRPTLVTIGDLLARAPRFKLLLAGRNDEQFGAGIAARLVGVQKPRLIQLLPLSPDGAKAYIEHRLNVAGSGGRELITADAHTMIFQHTAGSPRLINVLCDAALHAACLRASGQVNASEILVATQDARWPEALAREKAGPGSDPHLETPAAAEFEESTAPAARLLVSHREEHIATLPLTDGRISIGRASDNELRLEATFVSRHHCQIVTVGTMSVIEDLGSVNGIIVNGKAVKRHVLQHGDKIVVGQHVITYVVA